MTPGRWWLLTTALLLGAALGVAVGAVSIPFSELGDILQGRGDPQRAAIVLQLRLPRVALAAIVGAGLALSGAALQSTLRNPLAEPYLLGVSGGAATGAVVAVALGLVAAAWLPIAAFAGAATSVALVLLVARAAGGRTDPRTVLMAGVVIGAFAHAVIIVALAGASEQAVRGALWWMMGSVADADWPTVRAVGGWVALGSALLWRWGPLLDVLALGDDAAAALGADLDRDAPRAYLAAALVAAATVAGAGLVGFVGLVTPAIARGLGARGARTTLAVSALAGATLVILADVLARVARPPMELPLGAITALIGVPFFLGRLRQAVR